VACTALLPMVDPEALEEAIKAGVGRTITLWVGGKRDDVFNAPVEVTGRVTAISEGLKIELPLGFSDLGRTALVEIDGVKMVLVEHRSVGVNHPILYTHLGLEVANAKMVVLKTASNFQFFAPWRKKLIRVDSPGMTQSDLTEFEWVRAPHPIYPLDDLQEWKAKA